MRVSSVLVLSFVICCPLSWAESEPPFYEIKLDGNPYDRWSQVCIDLKPAIQHVYDSFLYSVKNSEMSKEWFELTEYAFHHLSDEYQTEMRSFSDCTGYSLMDVAAANLVYDFTAYCTSIVAENCDGKIVHGRNLDYGTPQILRNAAVNLNFTNNGQTVFSALTFAGYIGTWTGFKEGVFSISANDRFKGAALYNVESIIADYAPIGLTIRDRLGDCTDFQSCVKQLSTIPLMAPVYFIIGGIESGEGVVITRNQTHSLNPLWIGSDNEWSWFVLETNYDWWTPTPTSDDRRDAGIADLNELGQCNLNSDTLFSQVMTQFPVKNPITTFTTVYGSGLSYHNNFTVDVWSNLPDEFEKSLKKKRND